MFETLKRGPVAIYFGANAATQRRRAHDFLTALGGDATRAVEFETDRAALTEAITRGEVAVLLAPETKDYFSIIVDALLLKLLTEKGVKLLTVFPPELISPDATMVQRLWRAEETAWQPLLEELVRGHLGHAAPQSFSGALLADNEDLTTWTDKAWRAAATMRSAYFVDGSTPRKKFAEWLHAGQRRTRPAEDPAVLKARYEALSERPPRDAIEQGRVLITDIDRELPGTELAARARMVTAVRCLEIGRWEEAEELADEARGLAKEALLDNLARLAHRISIGALLGQREFRAAFGNLEAIFAYELMFGANQVAAPQVHRPESNAAPLEASLRHVAALAQVTNGVEPEWRAALTTLAQQLTEAGDTKSAQQVTTWLK